MSKPPSRTQIIAGMIRQGMSNHEIAKQLGCHSKRVSEVRCEITPTTGMRWVDKRYDDDGKYMAAVQAIGMPGPEDAVIVIKRPRPTPVRVVASSYSSTARLLVEAA